MPITWNPPDPYASTFLSIAGGILAGFIVVGIEWVGRYCYARSRQRKTVRELRNFFTAWELGINAAQGMSLKLPDGTEETVEATKEQFQRAHHNDRINQFHISMHSRWGKHLSERQADEILLLVSGYERILQEPLLNLGISPHGHFPDQGIYDHFFELAREIRWLKF